MIPYKQLFRVGILVYIILLVYSILFFKERIILLDNSLYLFNMVEYDNFVIHHNRFITIFTQLLPLIGIKLLLPLKAVMILNSLSYMLLPVTCYLLSGFFYKNYKIALSLLLVNTLFITHTFYWGLSELIQGLCLMVFVFSIMLQSADATKRKLWLDVILLLLAVPTVVFAHPLIIIPFTFSIVYFLIHRDIKFHRVQGLLTCILFAGAYTVKRLYFTDGYDAQSMEMKNNIKNLFPNYFDTYSNIRFVKNWFRIYYWIPISVAIVLAVVAYKKQWLKFLFLLSAFVGFILLVNVSYPTGGTLEFYIENLYMPLSLILALPLVYDVLPKLNKYNLSVILILLICTTGLVRIFIWHRAYDGRVDWIRGYYTQHQDQKIVVDNSVAPANTMLMTWASPYEFWLLSTLETGKTASINIAENIEDYRWAQFEKKSFLATWGIYEYGTLNERYFNFTDTATTYLYRGADATR